MVGFGISGLAWELGFLLRFPLFLILHTKAWVTRKKHLPFGEDAKAVYKANTHIYTKTG